MTHEEFNQLAAAGYNRIPVTLELFADLDTPLSVYLKLANQPYSYLLESVVGASALDATPSSACPPPPACASMNRCRWNMATR
jgi:anthranilate/para-aminobenzoate synthase component I